MEKRNKQPISINQLTGESHLIPDNLEDKIAIDDFLNQNKEKPVVVVQGLGFVGAVMSLVCANAITEEYAVIGVDLARPATYWKIKSINEGVFPVVASDPKIENFYDLAMKKGNLFATYDAYAYSRADTIIVDINLDVDKSTGFYGDLEAYEVDLTAFKKAIEAIGKNCKEDVLILIETTVPPGTSQKIAHPIIKSCLEERGLSTDKFKLGHSYERVMPGPDYIDSIQNFYRVYSGVDNRSADATEEFLRTIISTKEYPLTRLGNTNATEMAKVLENSYRAMNIAFAVEWSRFAEESGVNLYEVVRAIRMRPTHKNLMLPGIGVGGYCLTKDPLLASWSKQTLFSSNEALSQSEQGVKINDKMPLYAYQFMKRELELEDLDGKNALLLGVSYRSNVGDTRYSPVEPFYNYLKKDNAKVKLHDPYVRLWEEKDILVLEDIKKAFETSLDIVVISTGHVEYRNSEELMNLLMSQVDLFILDTVGLLSDKEIKCLSQKHKVRVVGRGDIN
ncbi:MAG: NDP-sugar dehydrogenase [Flavobacteriaceae bacterium]|nr:NDP-sugar dehydrogenase [Flavobacteriaceae bacterium]|tara:strand:- start:6133 stop:7653 length:1521 start_codon:yes stop_codon:yes gene_type:complete